jgi:hypothetical protein
MKKIATSRLMFLGVIIGLILVNNGCTRKKPGTQEITMKMKFEPGEPLAHVGGITLSLEELRKNFLDTQGAFRNAPHLNTEKKRNEYVETQVTQLAIFLEAVKNGVLNDPKIRRDIQKIVVQHAMREKLSQAQDAYVANDEEIKEYYEKNPIHFNRDEALKVAYIAVPFGTDPKGAEKVAHLLLKDANTKIKDANIKEFARLALNFAQTNAAASSGKIETNESEYLEKEAFEAKFGKDNFTKIKALESVGKLGPMLVTENSYYIVMKTGQRKELHESLEDSKARIAKRIAFEKRGEVYEKYLSELRKTYDIKIIKERVAELSNDPTPHANANMNAQAQNTPNSAPPAAPHAH